MILDKEARKRRRERYMIVAALILLACFTYVEIAFLNVGTREPLFNSVLFFALINLNVILLLLLIFLVVRNLVKLFIERKRKEPGARLKTRLVAGFVGLALMPTLFLFIISIQFISTSVEEWFNVNVERSLRDSLELGKTFYQQAGAALEKKGAKFLKEAERDSLFSPERQHQLVSLLEKRVKTWNLTLAGFYGTDKRELTVNQLSDIWSRLPFPGFDETVKKFLGAKEPGFEVRSISHREMLFVFVPASTTGSPNDGKDAVLVLAQFLPAALVERIGGISRGYEEYEQMKMVRRPIKVAHYVTLSIITLLIIFLATWFGFYLAKGITVPIQKLVDGTYAIASGNYAVHVDVQGPDEIGTLVDSFNRMANDLRVGKDELEKTNQELLQRTVELEQRRRYMEVMLDNVATGVIAVDKDGLVTTINRSAEHILNIRAGRYVKKHFKNVLRPPYDGIVREFIDELTLTRTGSVGRTIRLSLGTETKTLMVNFTMLYDEDDRYMGMVVVLDDLSHIEKAQRALAWREVARRIAHEVKNPLTPIQLSAQRLKKRYRHHIGEDVAIFDECTDTIVKQVEELKSLVNEFSNFARMPSSNPALNNLNAMIDETIPLYGQAHKDVAFRFVKQSEPPLFSFDREQMKRVIINLLDNAVGAFDGGPGEVTISSDYDAILRIVRLEVADNGPGIKAEDKIRLFEPYFSTKKGGTGLGLAIVSTIISDHNGFIRVHDGAPCGTRFVIELPARS